MAKINFEPGDKVKWDGSGDARYPRPYYGVIQSIGDGVANVLDDEWFAISGVALYKLHLLTRDDQIDHCRCSCSNPEGRPEFGCKCLCH